MHLAIVRRGVGHDFTTCGIFGFQSMEDLAASLAEQGVSGEIQFLPLEAENFVVVLENEYTSTDDEAFTALCDLSNVLPERTSIAPLANLSFGGISDTLTAAIMDSVGERKWKTLQITPKYFGDN